MMAPLTASWNDRACKLSCCVALPQVTELWQFFVLRMLTGVAVGGCFPLVFSLLGDLFPVSQRSAMAALVQIAVGAGIGGGQVGRARQCSQQLGQGWPCYHW
jgi:MFS family permease